MKTYTLPEDLTPLESSEILVYDYHALNESSKQQVDLSMNAFSFLQEGHKEVFSDSIPTSIDNNRFLLMKAGKCLMTETFSAQDQSYRSILLFFSDETVLKFSRKYSITLSKPKKRETIRPIPYDAFTRSFVQGILALNQLSKKNRKRILQIKFEELFIYLLDSMGNDFLECLIEDVNDYDVHFHQVIQHNKLKKLTLNELAFLSNMSLSTFKRKFEKEFNAPPSKWFLEKRLEHAALLLKNEKRRPSDIFEEVGYESLSNFIQAFKIQFGKTPKQYQSE